MSGPLARAIPDVVVIIPTYNEVESLVDLHGRVRAANPGVGILVVDDNSPDGTGRIADRLAVTDPLTWALHRPGKGGLGTAYLLGMSWALTAGVALVVQMDADGSHLPEALPQLLAASQRGADVVIGSRYVEGGRTVGWPLRRRVLSRAGNCYARSLLGLTVRDATSGYRVYTRRALEDLTLPRVKSEGYCFLVELSLLATRRGLRVVEVPITFVERARGASKMDWAVGLETLRRVTMWGIRGRLARGNRAKPPRGRQAVDMAGSLRLSGKG
jgi:dolichol-phosphate mannosyltransferase